MTDSLLYGKTTLLKFWDTAFSGVQRILSVTISNLVTEETVFLCITLSLTNFTCILTDKRNATFKIKVIPQPLYNTIVGVQANFRVSYPNHNESKCLDYIGKRILNSHLGSCSDLYYIQNCVIMKCVTKRFRCTYKQLYRTTLMTTLLKTINNILKVSQFL